MSNQSPVAIFLAASAILAASTLNPEATLAGKDLGGLKEWTTDQSIEEESTLDADAEELKKEAEEEDYCIPIGEGENCW